MNDDWKTATCEHCYYNVEGQCRYNPPTSLTLGSHYPATTLLGVSYNKACSRYTLPMAKITGGETQAELAS